MSILGLWCIVGAFGAQEEFRVRVGSLEMLHSGGVWKVPGAALGCPTQNDHCLD